MLKLALVNADKNSDGSLSKPDVSKINSIKQLNAIATDDKPHTVTPKGYAGESFAAGQLYAGNFDTDANKFAGNLVSLASDKLPGDATPKGVHVNGDGSVSEE